MNDQELHNFVMELQFAEDIQGIIALMDSLEQIGVRFESYRDIKVEK